MSAVAEMNLVLDAEGFLTSPDDWTPETAAALAAEDGLELNDRHWVVINFVRDEYAKNGAFPSLRAIGKRSGVNTKELYQLFPKGPAKKIARTSGFGKPKGCI